MSQIKVNRKSKYKTIKIKAMGLLEQTSCVYCGSTWHLTLDHIIPLSKNGLDSFANYQILCKSCNDKKKSEIYDEYSKSYSPEFVLNILYSSSVYPYRDYKRAVFNSAFPNITEHSMLSLNALKKSREYFEAYGINFNEFFKLLEQKTWHLMPSYIPNKHKLSISFDPQFNISKKDLDNYFRSRKYE